MVCVSASLNGSTSRSEYNLNIFHLLFGLNNKELSVHLHTYQKSFLCPLSVFLTLSHVTAESVDFTKYFPASECLCFTAACFKCR